MEPIDENKFSQEHYLSMRGLDKQMERQKWLETYRDKVTDLPTEEAVEMLLKGTGFVLYSNLYSEEDVTAAHQEILD